MPTMLPVVYALLTFAWLRAALAPMVTAVGRAIRDPGRWWPAPLFALVPLAIWVAIGAASLMIALSAAPGLAGILLERSSRMGLIVGVAGWAVLLVIRAPGFRWVELEWPIGRDPRRSIYARYVPVRDRARSQTAVMRALIRAATALLVLFLT